MLKHVQCSCIKVKQTLVQEDIKSQKISITRNIVLGFNAMDVA